MHKVGTRIPRVVLVIGLIAGLFLAAAPASAGPPGAEQPAVTFTLLTPLPTEMAVGETAIIGVRVESSTPFVMAIALSNAYYPGRAVLFDGSPAQPRATSADLYLTVTARGSTADLAPVQNWPSNEDWPAGVAPVAVAVGARFAGGGVVGTQFPFAITVP